MIKSNSAPSTKIYVKNYPDNGLVLCCPYTKSASKYCSTNQIVHEMLKEKSNFNIIATASEFFVVIK